MIPNPAMLLDSIEEEEDVEKSSDDEEPNKEEDDEIPEKVSCMHKLLKTDFA